MKTSVIFIFLWLLLGLIWSCTREEENIFDEPSTTRLHEQAEVLQQELLSSQDGWCLAYSPDTSRLGVFTFLMNFNDEKTVTMLSDFDTIQSIPTQSEYEIKLGSSIKLSFVTKNEIHKLSDSGNPPSSEFSNKGYEGDFEFIYYGKEGEDLLFRGNRTYAAVRFRKASEQDWQDLGLARESLRRMSKKRDAFDPSFEIMLLDVGSRTFSYQLETTIATRFFRWAGINFFNAQAGAPLSFGIALTPSGFITSTFYIGQNSLALNFVYIPDRGVFEARQNGLTATIRRALPYNPEQAFGIQDNGEGFYAFIFSMDSDGDSREAPANSDAFLELLASVANSIEVQVSWRLLTVGIYVDIPSRVNGNTYSFISYDFLDEEGDREELFHLFSYTIIDNERVRMTPLSSRPWLSSFSSFTTASDTTSSKVIPLLASLDNVFLDSDLYMVETPRFSRYSNRIFAFKNAGNPALIAGGFYSFSE